MAMNKSTREAIAALRDFAEAARQQYTANVELFSKPKGALFDPSSKLAPFAAGALTAAQSFTDESGEGFVLLGHLDGANVEFGETEALIWLANDAVTFDKLARAEESLRPLAQMHGERAIARAVYLKALLGGYLRALDGGLLKGAVGGDRDIAKKAAQHSQQSVNEFVAGIEALLPRAKFRQELSAFAQAMMFPMLPMAVGHKKANWEVVHGVALTSDLAQQWRAGLARQRPAQQKKP
jgi:hypothetical protein